MAVTPKNKSRKKKGKWSDKLTWWYQDPLSIDICLSDGAQNGAHKFLTKWGWFVITK